MKDEGVRLRNLREERRPGSPSILSPSAFILRLRRALRGGVTWRAALLEAGRRGRAVLEHRRERAMLAQHDSFGVKARLSQEFARMDAKDLLAHFRTRASPKFLPGFNLPAAEVSRLQRRHFPSETERLIESARSVTEQHAWPLLGYGLKSFGAEIDWLRDPLSGARWPLSYHCDVNLFRGDGSDARVLWEVNRLAHLNTLARAYTINGDERFASEFFAQVESWRAQNPLGRGANWNCAMEAALRSLNLLAAFQLFRRSEHFTQARLFALLASFEEHGAHIRRNLEFSHLVTSNHYLSDVVGLLWLGVCLPELEAAREWREFGLREMLREMDKQVYVDGADAEASTGYHRLVLELFLYSFILCRANLIEIDERYWGKLRAMLDYVDAYLRPDGRAPLVGDTDSGQVLPITRRAADEHAYVLAVGAALFEEPRWKSTCEAVRDSAREARVDSGAHEELLWMLGGEGLDVYRRLPREASHAATTSRAFPEAGTYIMREGDLYLFLNAGGTGLGGRGSHGHNDALSIEVGACGASFIADPGTYVYTSDLRERHLFRSTAYHSTVEVDGAEQNTTVEETPFDIGDEARPRVSLWETGARRDRVIAEHDGYKRLASGAITHRRAVTFDRRARLWLIEDTLAGAGEHVFRFLFHFAPGTEARVRADEIVEVCDKMTGARLLVVARGAPWATPTIEARWSSRDYGAKTPSRAACWRVRAVAPFVARWALLPVCAVEDEPQRLKQLSSVEI